MENTLHLYIPAGKVVIQMHPNKAPLHCAQIKELVNKGFYNGLKFHRVIEGFMAQGGCPNGNGMGGADKNIKAEFNDLPHVRGTVSMARSQDPNSASSQFFICTAPARFLDGQYSGWGTVVEGMEHVDALKKGHPNQNGTVVDPDCIIKAVMAAQEKAE